VSLEERVEAAVDGLETRLEDKHSIEAIEMQEARDNAASGGVWAGCRSNALEKRARREQVADGRSELARRDQFLGLLDAG
jgi:hypothetical protein